MNAERKKILEMLAEGKITADEADKLLDKLACLSSSESKSEAGVGTKSDAKAEIGIGFGAKPNDGCSSKPRFMRIVIDKPGHDQVNVRMPLAFMRTGSNLLAVLPSQVREKLAERGIDIAGVAAMDAKDWDDALENMNIDIEKGDGKKVKIFCE